jgi:hypothetical protein
MKKLILSALYGFCSKLYKEGNKTLSIPCSFIGSKFKGSLSVLFSKIKLLTAKKNGTHIKTHA